jgi:hypothetical protein
MDKINWGNHKKKTHCLHCKTKLKYENTSVWSMVKGYCHKCHNNLVNKGVLKP